VRDWLADRNFPEQKPGMRGHRRGFSKTNLLLGSLSGSLYAVGSRRGTRRIRCRQSSLEAPERATVKAIALDLSRQVGASSATQEYPDDGNGDSIVEELYRKFNDCDADGTANCFTHDVVYEDLILGKATIVESREEFREVIEMHPVFMGRRLCDSLGIAPVDIRVVVDSLAEDPVRGTVGVEWHVEVWDEPLPLGRGLSHMKICRDTGLIKRAVDLVEAPWRVIGIIIGPFARFFLRWPWRSDDARRH